MKSPIFIFSLPRSGSTLLQRILMSHSQIASLAEPWLMLPLSYVHKKEGIVTEYSHAISCDAFEDFIRNLPKGKIDYYQELNSFASALYEKQCVNNEIYFIDKTPRYYFIIPEIINIFPDAKFIFLFRNPLHVMSSIIQTWCDGSLRMLYAFERDLTYGPIALTTGYHLLKDRAHVLQYEKLVIDPEYHIKKICDYLNLDFEQTMITSFSNQDTKGRLGDPTGIYEYNYVSDGSLEKWKDTFNTVYRKKLAFNYINDIDECIFNAQGYDKNLILHEIHGLVVKHKKDIVDRADFMYSFLIRYMKANIFFEKKVRSWANGIFLS